MAENQQAALIARLRFHVTTVNADALGLRYYASCRCGWTNYAASTYEEAAAEAAKHAKASDRAREAVEAIVRYCEGAMCHHCGRLPDDDGDHSCPCPYRDDECPDHPQAPASSPAGEQR